MKWVLLGVAGYYVLNTVYESARQQAVTACPNVKLPSGNVVPGYSGNVTPGQGYPICSAYAAFQQGWGWFTPISLSKIIGPF